MNFDWMKNVKMDYKLILCVQVNYWREKML